MSNTHMLKGPSGNWNAIKNAGKLVEKIKMIKLEPNDILVDCDVSSFCRKMPLDAFDKLKKSLWEEDLELPLLILVLQLVQLVNIIVLHIPRRILRVDGSCSYGITVTLADSEHLHTSL